MDFGIAWYVVSDRAPGLLEPRIERIILCNAVSVTTESMSYNDIFFEVRVPVLYSAWFAVATCIL